MPEGLSFVPESEAQSNEVWKEVPDFVSGHLSKEDDPYSGERGDFIESNQQPEGTVLEMKAVDGKPEFRWAEPSGDQKVNFEVQDYNTGEILKKK